MADILCYAVRNVAGFLLQIVPCALLCFAPFRDSLAHGVRATAARVGAVLTVALVPFVVAGSMPLTSDIALSRFLVQNAIFMATLAVLLGVYVRSVDADAQHKAFVFLSVMCYGFIVTTFNDAFATALPVGDDGHMYRPWSLLTLALLNACGLPLMLRLMGLVRDLLRAPLEQGTWHFMSAVPPPSWPSST